MLSNDDITANVRKLIPLFDFMQLRVVAASPGTATVEIPQEPNGNHFGVVYAGALYSIAEVLGGIIPMATWDAPGYLPLVKDMQISFLRPGKGTISSTATLSDDEVKRVADAIGTEPKIDFVLEATLTDEQGTVVATTSGTYQMRKL